MLGRSRFIRGRSPQRKGKKESTSTTDCIGPTTIPADADAATDVKTPLPLSESLQQLNRKQNSANAMLSSNAAQMLGFPGYALELESDCASVSSMNDSCFGGASVTGGYSSRRFSKSPLKQAKSLVVGVIPGASPDAPADLLGAMLDDCSDFQSVDDTATEDLEAQAIPPPNNQLAVIKMDSVAISTSQKASKDVVSADSPTAGQMSASSSEASPSSQEYAGKCCCCSACPRWFRRAPKMLRVVVCGSVILLLGAVVLVVVGLALTLKSKSSVKQSFSPGQSDVPPSPVKTVRPTTAPIVSPISSHSTTTASPTRAQNNLGNGGAVNTDLENLMTIYVTAGRYSDDLLQQAGSDLGSIPTREGTAFMVHLGDWNSPSSTNCNKDSYKQVSQLFQASSVPVYFVMGDSGTYSYSPGCG